VFYSHTGEAMPTVSVKPVKSLGRYGDLNDTVRDECRRRQAVEGLKSITRHFVKKSNRLVVAFLQNKYQRLPLTLPHQRLNVEQAEK